MTDILSTLSEHLPLNPLAVQIGVACAVAQLTLTILFSERARVLPNGPWSHLPAFTANHLVAFPLMVLLTYVGWRDWFFHPFWREAAELSATDRVFGYSNPNDVALAVGSGAILLWDIPMGFLSPPLRDPVMWAHHVGMFMTAATMSGTFCKGGTMIGYYYVPYYFGVIELSSMFLGVVDVFHPKYVHYYKWLNAKHTDERSQSLVRMVNNMNDLARRSFAFSFLALRGIYFPYVSFRQAIPDLVQAYKSPPDGVPMWTGYFLISMISLFTLLQAYWGVLIAKQVKKVLVEGDSCKKSN